MLHTCEKLCHSLSFECFCTCYGHIRAAFYHLAVFSTARLWICCKMASLRSIQMTSILSRSSRSSLCESSGNPLPLFLFEDVTVRHKEFPSVYQHGFKSKQVSPPAKEGEKESVIMSNAIIYRVE